MDVESRQGSICDKLTNSDMYFFGVWVCFVVVFDAIAVGGVVFGAFGLFLFSRWSAWVAPVRGGTYFSFQRQRKVGKRKPLKPLAPATVHISPLMVNGSGASVTSHHPG
jgi:hypothetical protein